MVENIVAIELAYVNTRHPDFYKDMANISSMLKSPDLETERMNQVNRILIINFIRTILFLPIIFANLFAFYVLHVV